MIPLCYSNSLGSCTATDRVNGVVHKAVFIVSHESGVEATMSGALFDGINTNEERGLIYFEVTVKTACEHCVDTGTVSDGDVDCSATRDEKGAAADGD